MGVMTTATLLRLKAWILAGLMAIVFSGIWFPVHAQPKIPPLKGLVTDVTGT